MTETRANTKRAHMQHLDNGIVGLRVLQSGPLLDSRGSEIGSLIIVEADAISTVTKFSEADPYFALGMFQSVDISRWQWRRGNPYLTEAQNDGGPREE